MSVLHFILRSLWFFRKQHLSVMLGTAVSAAVLTGALIIGDSVNYSLRNLVESRLGNTRYVIAPGSRFVRAKLAAELASETKIATTPLLLLQGIAINAETETRINTAQIIGIDSSFRAFSSKPLQIPGNDEAIISENVASRMNLKIGQEILLRIENASVIPVNAPFVPENKPTVAMRLTIVGIADNNSLGRFSLRNNQTAPYNIFVSRPFIAEKLKLNDLSNCILLAGNPNVTKDTLDAALRRTWQPEDAGLNIRTLPETNNFEVVSTRVFIDKPIEEAIHNASYNHENVLTYLVNSLHGREKTTPYSFVSAVSPTLLPADFHENDILVNQWLADDLGVKAGDSLTLDYYIIGSMRTLHEKSARFVIKNIIAIENGDINRSLMPLFPGLSDAGSCKDWNTGIPIDLKRIRDKDEQYWNDYKGTPKAVIAFAKGRELWGNQFGNLTSVRFAQTAVSPEKLKNSLKTHLNPADIGINVTQVYQQGIQAADNSVNFGELFLSLSFFVIAASIMLTVLLHILNTESRGMETGILSGMGFTRKDIFRIRIAESGLVIVIGGILGAFCGILYNYALMAGLNTLWQDAVRTNMLQVSVRIPTLVTGGVSGMAIAFLSVWMVTRRGLKRTVANLVKNNVSEAANTSGHRKWVTIAAYSGIFGALALVGVSVALGEYENALLFLSAGGLFLAGSISMFTLYLEKITRVPGSGVPGIMELAVKNAGRKRGRSLTIVMVLAIGMFSVILTGSYRKTFSGSEQSVQSGTGGFLFWAETSLPVVYSLDGAKGRENLLTQSPNDLAGVTFFQLQGLDGDDASCLNLNQVQKPRILGIPANEFNKRNAFTFAKITNDVDREHPWASLAKNEGHNVYAAFADQTVIQYGLKKTIGDTLKYTDEMGDTLKFVLKGGLDNSIFQGNLLVSDEVFKTHFPSAGGSKVMLVDASAQKDSMLRQILRQSFADLGIEVTSAPARLAEFNSVENTYLSVFMALGTLGILIGTIGLGIILYRNMLERKHELSLLSSLGFTRKQVFRLVVTENLFLLLCGILCGILSAIIAIVPSVVSPAFSVNGMFLLLTTLVILMVGTAWIVFLVRQAMKGQLAVMLRNE